MHLDMRSLTGAKLSFRSTYGLLVKITRPYDEDELTQAQIAERLRIFRQKTQRMISQARTSDPVLIEIHPIMGIYSDLEKSLEQRFDLREAVERRPATTTRCEKLVPEQ